jgi:Family of unknown function (DUF6011)
MRKVQMTATTSQPARCLRCGRTLTAPASVKASYGPTCRARIRAAALAAALDGFTTAQADKARELIADGGMVPTGHAGVWRAVGSDGAALYLAAPQACNCPAGLHGRACYHQAAARVLTATRKAA